MNAIQSLLNTKKSNPRIGINSSQMDNNAEFINRMMQWQQAQSMAQPEALFGDRGQGQIDPNQFNVTPFNQSSPFNITQAVQSLPNEQPRPTVKDPFSFLKYPETPEDVGYAPLDEKKKKRLQQIAKGQALGQGLATLFNSVLIGTDNDIATPNLPGEIDRTFKEINYLDDEYKDGWKKARDLAFQGKLGNLENENKAALAQFQADNNLALEAERQKGDAANLEARLNNALALQKGNQEFQAQEGRKDRQNRYSIANGGDTKYQVPPEVADYVNHQITELEKELNNQESMQDKDLLRSNIEALQKLENWNPANNVNHQGIWQKAQEYQQSQKTSQAIDNSITSMLSNDGEIDPNELNSLKVLMSFNYPNFTPNDIEYNLNKLIEEKKLSMPEIVDQPVNTEQLKGVAKVKAEEEAKLKDEQTAQVNYKTAIERELNNSNEDAYRFLKDNLKPEENAALLEMSVVDQSNFLLKKLNKTNSFEKTPVQASNYGGTAVSNPGINILSLKKALEDNLKKYNSDK